MWRWWWWDLLCTLSSSDSSSEESSKSSHNESIWKWLQVSQLNQMCLFGSVFSSTLSVYHWTRLNIFRNRHITQRELGLNKSFTGRLHQMLASFELAMWGNHVSVWRDQQRPQIRTAVTAVTAAMATKGEEGERSSSLQRLTNAQRVIAWQISSFSSRSTDTDSSFQSRYVHPEDRAVSKCILQNWSCVVFRITVR